MFLAAAPFAVRDAHYVKHDVPATLLITLAVMAAVRLAEDGSQSRDRRLVIAAATAGFAVSSHYYAVFVGLPLMCGLWLAWSDSSLRQAGRQDRPSGRHRGHRVLPGSPFLLAEPLTAWRDIRANRRIVIDRAAEIGGQAFASAPEINAACSGRTPRAGRSSCCQWPAS